MESIKDFDILICGEPTSDMYEFKTVMNNLAKKIGKMTELIIGFEPNSDNASIDRKSVV